MANRWEKVEALAGLIFLGSNITASYLRKDFLERHEFARMDEYLVSGNRSMMIPETGHCSSNWIKGLVGSCGSSREG